MRTWIEWLSDPRLPAKTLVTWPLLAALWAGAEDIGSTTAVLCAACVLMIGRVASSQMLRPVVPVSIGICAAVIFAHEAWAIGLLVMVVLPILASALTTIADRRMSTVSGSGQPL